MNQQMLRLERNVRRGQEVHFQVDGQPAVAYEGETIATALMAAGRRVFRHTAEGEPRGVFCGIGMCFDCMVDVDGRNVRACLTPAREGMIVTTVARPVIEQRS
jgi:predicted molibdopterin-dependent oxidoreductase YjgC